MNLITTSQLEDKLSKITHTYFIGGNEIKTDRLYYYWTSIHNGYDKSQNRINNALEQIKNKIKAKIQFDKKYQIRCIEEFKIIEDFCIQNQLKYEFIIDKNIFSNKVVNIKQYTHDTDDYDYYMKVTNKKIPVMYIRVIYNPISNIKPIYEISNID